LAKNYRNRIAYFKIIASQRWDVFETQCNRTAVPSKSAAGRNTPGEYIYERSQVLTVCIWCCLWQRSAATVLRWGDVTSVQRRLILTTGLTNEPT